MTCSEPERETEKVEKLFQAFVEAKKTAGEDIARLTHAGFTEFVRKKTKDLQQQKNCNEVEYVVEIVDNQVKLKALVKSLGKFFLQEVSTVHSFSDSLAPPLNWF